VITLICLQVVDNMINGGNTANIFAIDISKAYDSVNHHGLLIKLIAKTDNQFNT